MNAQMAIFVLLAAVGLSSAILVITRKNPVHSALYLIVTFFSVAGVYVVLSAPFIAVVQVLVYAGGIMVLFLFVIMLVETPAGGAVEVRRSSRGHVVTAGVLTALVAGFLAYHVALASLVPSGDVSALAADGGNIETVALSLFRYYLLPFEVVSILLLVAMVGAIVLARAKV